MKKDQRMIILKKKKERRNWKETRLLRKGVRGRTPSMKQMVLPGKLS